MNDWSTLKKLIWLHIVKGGGGIERTVKGAIVHVTNALARPAISVKCEVNPIQDLHGYDSPWPAGGGKNLLENTVATTTKNNVTFTRNTDGSVTASASAAASGHAQIQIPFSGIEGDFYFCGCPSGGGNSTYDVYAWDATAKARFKQWDGTTASISDYGDNTLNQIKVPSGHSGYIVLRVVSGYQPDNIKFTPMLLKSTETSNAWSPYSNICPISGWTECKVTRTGINVWNGTSESGYIDVNTGDPRASDTQSRSLFVEVKPSTQYCYVNEHVSSGVRIAFYDNEKIFCGNFANGNANPQTFTTPANAHYLRFYWGDISKVSINYPSTDHDYHAYQGNTYTIALGDTVYGGTLDVTTGKLTVTWAKRILNGSEIWAGTPESGWYTQENNLKKLTSYVGHMMADTLPAGSGGENRLYGYIDINNIYPSENWIYYKNSNMTSATQAKAFFATNPTQVVYELATPIEITLTPTQIEMLLGENNLWSDGEMTLVYLADGNASDVEALNILLGGRYVNNHGEDEPTDREALNIILGGNTR